MGIGTLVPSMELENNLCNMKVGGRKGMGLLMCTLDREQSPAFRPPVVMYNAVPN